MVWRGRQTEQQDAKPNNRTPNRTGKQHAKPNGWFVHLVMGRMREQEEEDIKLNP